MNLIFGILLTAVASASAQGTFQNLDFEEANPVSTGNPPFVTAASALPGWTIFCGTTQQTEVALNAESTGQAVANIFGPGSSVPAIDGNYSAGLQGGGNPQTGGSVTTSLEQTGGFPVGDQSLLFKAWGQIGGLSVDVNGTSLPLFTLAATGNYTLFGVDVSAYAGQTATLALVDAPNPPAVGLVELDDITFSTSSVPEPSSAVLGALGGLMFAAYRRLKKRPQT